MPTTEIWIDRQNSRWRVTRNGRPGRLGQFDAEADAIARGRALAAFLGCDLVIKTGGRERRESDLDFDGGLTYA